ncbi:hypothetical protein PCI56_14310 [Plesiomonas shigelloides subsp. oncorhynchi]|nr:hypothetical protein [Plesiomonas shigelloides]
MCAFLCLLSVGVVLMHFAQTEDRRQKTEDRRQKTEDRRQKTEDRRQKTEDRIRARLRWKERQQPKYSTLAAAWRESIGDE